MKDKVILASGIFYPDVGGPAIHVDKIAQRLQERGWEPVVIAYGNPIDKETRPFRVFRISRGHFRWLHYFLAVWREARTADLIYAFDPTAAGLPAGLVAKLRHLPFVIRIGGDPIWERVVETGQRFLPLTDYYRRGLYLVDKPWLYHCIRWLVRRPAAIVVYNQFFADFYTRYFGADPTRVKIVKNPIFVRGETDPVLPAKPKILFAGRFVAYKNLDLVIRALVRICSQHAGVSLQLVGTGPDQARLVQLVGALGLKEVVEFRAPVPQEELFELIKQSAIVIGPALSEFNPNSVLEALSFGKPVLLSRDHGLSVALPEQFLFNPLDQSDFETKVVSLLQPDNYARAIDLVAQLDRQQTWDKVLDFHQNLLAGLI